MKKDKSEDCDSKECVLMHKVALVLLRQVYSEHELVTPKRMKGVEDLLLQRIEGLKDFVRR